MKKQKDKQETLLAILLFLLGVGALIATYYLTKEMFVVTSPLEKEDTLIKSDTNTAIEEVIEYDIDTGNLYRLHNAYRKEAGLDPLIWSPLLAQSALEKAEYMNDTDCWEHICNDVTPWDYIRKQGIVYEFAGENLGRRMSKSDTYTTSWMNSSPHRKNILSENFDIIGIAYIMWDYGQGEEPLIVVHFTD